MSSRFKSGPWSGSRNIGPKKIDMELDLKFHNGAVEGNGTDEIGELHINGTYEERPPFSSKLLVTYFGQESMEFNGFRESEGGGIFGTWKTSQATAGPKSGDFHIKPKQRSPEETARMQAVAMEKATTQLVNMGFAPEICELALQQNGANVENALTWLLEHGGVMAGSGGGQVVHHTNTVTINDSKANVEYVKQLQEMGFSAEQAELALTQTNNDLTTAVELLFAGTGQS